MLLGTLAAILLPTLLLSMSKGKEVMNVGDGVNRADEGVIRAGEEKYF